MSRHRESQTELEPREIRFALGEIPTDFVYQVRQLLLKYSTPLVGVRQPDFYAHCGSGTLVQSSGQHYVMTAGHCVERIFAKNSKGEECEEIGLSIIEDRPHPFSIPMLPPIKVDPPKEFGEWGPDLAFLPIPPSKVAEISAFKSFLNLDLRRERMLQGKPETGRGLWAVVGAPMSRFSLVDDHKLEFGVGVHFCAIEKLHETASYDYLDIVPWDVEDATTTYQGISGGGLWQIDVGRSADGIFHMGPPSLSPPALEGCAFYEAVANDGRLFIRCHGRRSIYGHGMAALSTT